MRSLLRGVAERLRRMTGRGPAVTTTPARPRPPSRSTAAPRPTPPPRTAAPVTSSTAAPKGRHLAYAPNLDGNADPGEIVWFWVPYEDDPQLGKDRPVLVVGRDGNVLLGLMLSSRAARDGQANWLALGSGEWDGQHRPSWVRLDRVLRVPASGVRREGSVLDRPRFEAVAARLRAAHGWS